MKHLVIEHFTGSGGECCECEASARYIKSAAPKRARASEEAFTVDEVLHSELKGAEGTL